MRHAADRSSNASAMTFKFIGLVATVVVLFAIDLAVGDTMLPLADVWQALVGEADELTHAIVVDIRLVKCVVALAAGIALSVSGLQMQVLFRNPLAGPYVLGVSSGASLGVALYVLGVPLLGSAASAMGAVGTVGAAWIGAAAMLIVVGWVGTRFRDIMVVLILGMLFSSGIGAIVQILQYLSREESLKAFVVWTMGSLGDVTRGQLLVMIPSIAVGCVLAVVAIKPLNLLLLGEDYAATSGLNMARSRGLLFLSTTLLAGTTTAFCGPLGFIGMAMPHVARYLFGVADNKVMVPGAMLVGGATMLLCDIVAKFFVVPINSVTALLGIPIVAAIVFFNRTTVR